MTKYLLIFISILVFSLLGFFSVYLMVDVPNINGFADVLGQFRYMLKEIAMFIGLLPYFIYLLLHFGISAALYSFPLKSHSHRLPLILLLNGFTAFAISFYWASNTEWDVYLR